MDENTWRERISYRMDQAARLTHLTRGESDDDAFETLWKILTDKKLIGSGHDGDRGFIVGRDRAVCFQEVPLHSIVENLFFEERLGGRKRYSWFGLRFNKIGMFCRGARPVIYGKTAELKAILPEDQYWKIVNHSLDEDNKIDWSHEREWRIEGDFVFDFNDVEILVKNDLYYRRFVKKCIDENREDILIRIRGIVPLNSVIS